MPEGEFQRTHPRRTFLADVRHFLLRRPPVGTLVDQSTPARREHYSRSILQRLRIDVSTYSVLNIHRIGIDAPRAAVFAELLAWDGEARYWPNRVARAERVDGRLEHIEIYLLGWRRFLFFRVKPLFRMEAVEIRGDPGTDAMDDARFLLFTCEGGYPIGHFTMYLRSPIAANGETEPSQLFLAVGFDFYGHRELGRRRWARPIRRMWEIIHNRMTGNILCHLKAICENDFQSQPAPSPPNGSPSARQ